MKKVSGPALPGAMVHPVMSILSPAAPLLPGSCRPCRCPHPAMVASPVLPESNSTQPQKPPSWSAPQTAGLSQLPEIPICQSALLPYALAGALVAMMPANASMLTIAVSTASRRITVASLCALCATSPLPGLPRPPPRPDIGKCPTVTPGATDDDRPAGERGGRGRP